MNLLKMNLSAVSFFLLNKNFQALLPLLHKTLTPEKFLFSQKGQTIKPLSVKMKHHCPYTAKNRLISLFHGQDKDTEEVFSEGSPTHLYCHCLGWEGRDEDSPLGDAPPAPVETVDPEGDPGTSLKIIPPGYVYIGKMTGRA